MNQNTVYAQKLEQLLERAKNYEWADSPATALADLLADVRHLCDLEGLDYAKLDETAYSHYQMDLEEHGGPASRRKQDWSPRKAP